MADAVFRVDIAAIKVDDCSVFVIDREDNAVVKGLIAFLVEYTQVFQCLDYFRIVRQDVFQAAVHEAGAEVGEGLIVLYPSAFQILQASLIFSKGVLIVANDTGQQLLAGNVDLWSFFFNCCFCFSSFLQLSAGEVALEPFHCLVKTEIVKELDKADIVAALVAAEAVP